MLIERNFEEATKVKVLIFKENKYNSNEIINELTYNDLVSWKILKDEHAKEIEDSLIDEEKDLYHEYLVLQFDDGSQATFNNSEVEMYKWF